MLWHFLLFFCLYTVYLPGILHDCTSNCDHHCLSLIFSSYLLQSVSVIFVCLHSCLVSHTCHFSIALWAGAFRSGHSGFHFDQSVQLFVVCLYLFVCLFHLILPAKHLFVRCLFEILCSLLFPSFYVSYISFGCFEFLSGRSRIICQWFQKKCLS